MKLLVNRTYATKTNNWYAPTCEYQEKHASILRTVIMDKTSSAGDWGGFFIQKIGKNRCAAISFYQENNYPNDGFILYTGTAFMLGPIEEDFVSAAQEEWIRRAAE